MNIDNIIKNTIFEFVNEHRNLFENLDLNNWDNIINWLNKNAPESIFDDNGNIDWDYREPMYGDDLETLIYTYKAIYNDVISKEKIEVYRLLKLNTINDLDINNVGVFWSFSKDNVGSYGITNTDDLNKNTFILTAIVKTADIDWESGFYSFLLYGRYELECNMKKGSECLITHINGKKLSTPIKGTC